ncbi:YD repeat-containing protein [Sinomicrobium oceani]|uniref:YD repeat-containing protein n=1 Tax=Sinomicrobium oceani TaxID=1150368 RepID=A0A1K1R916_9FLAO|nr:RHS repeat domain-containing protein [Sinomicrobium oceani]SFW68307.1 YD repeat-containing protein [Sinomicrobium oceani]
MKKIILCYFKNSPVMLVVTFFFTVTGFAQDNLSALLPEVVPNAPNASSLFKFENYEVNLYSGIPDISIPLYTIVMGEIEIPIALRYHASGIKVAENASWVGLGWALNTGGEITRQVNGGIDEKGYLINEIKKSTDIDITYPNASDLYYVSTASDGSEDYQPDIFSYNFPGRSGKFFFDGTDNNVVRLMPYAPVDVDASFTGSMSFNIVDEKGYLYVFGERYRDITNSSNGGVESISPSAWKLEDIISPNRQDTISYDYTTSSYTTFEGTTDLITVEDNVYQYMSAPYNYVPATSNISRYLGTSVDEAKVSEIKFKNGKIVFELSPYNREDLATKSLNRIIIYSKNFQGQFEKQREIEFNYSYFINGTDNLTKRLRLDAVIVKGKDNVDEEIYGFDYNSLMLPRKTSRAQDYWGYYNGKANSTLVPRMEINYISGINGSGSGNTLWIGSSVTDSRAPVESYMKAGSLKRITYPTKGYTEFEFEANRYVEGGDEMLAGGLRVKSIRSYNHPNDTSPLVRVYEYNSARPNFHLSNYLFQTNQTYMRYVTISGGTALKETKRVRNFVANPSVDIVTYEGMIVSYPKVTEYVMGNGDEPNGKTVYEYRDHSDIISSSQASQVLGRPLIISKFYNRGQLSNQSFYDYDLSTDSYNIKKSISYTYSAFDLTRYENIGFVASQRNVIEGAGKTYSGGEADIRYVYSNYVMESDDNYLVSKTETGYDNPSFPHSVRTVYAYDNIEHQQITRKSITKSDGTKEVTLITYPLDYSSGTSFIDVMQSNHWKAYPIEEVTYLEDNNNYSVLKGTITKYYDTGNGRGKPSEKLLLESDKWFPLSDFRFSNRSSLGVLPPSGTAAVFNPDPHYNNRISYDLYDDYGNLQQFHIPYGISTNFLWDYEAQYPIVKCDNANSEQTTHSSTAYKSVLLPAGPNSKKMYFTVERTGDINVSIQFDLVPEVGSMAKISCHLTGQNYSVIKNLCITNGGSSCGTTSYSAVFANLEPGDYELNSELFDWTNLNSGIKINMNYPTVRTEDIREYLFLNFEKSETTGEAHTGTGFFVGDYTVNFSLPNSRKYVLSYWYREGGVWKYSGELPYLGPSAILAKGDAIDDVRIHPKDSQMYTYTYDPLIGMTSKTDSSGNVIYYEYDSFNRLKAIKDGDGNLLSDQRYKYKN